MRIIPLVVAKRFNPVIYDIFVIHFNFYIIVTEQ